ncbi:MAG: prepilin-type N-terminal cleavage/methylation domain-containing protein [Candidatus Gracilibacteria bacterium]|nr:prepilin-type N-terminal cleavage/methylation domain-containing protein [Candidatus Gracilibacteria bacterium]
MPTPNNNKTSHTSHTLSHKNFLGFTLIELIVVITILVILGTIAFLNLGGFQSSARDSSRIENLSNLKKGLDIFQIKAGSYPVPENTVSVTASGITIGYQGFAKELTERTIGLSVGGTRDTLDTSIYTTYSVNADRTKMELMNFLEDGSTLLSLNAFVPNASADIGSDYSKRYPSVQGDTLGILLASGTLQPIQESGTGVDVVKTNSGYVAVFGKGESVFGTGGSLITAFTISSPDGKSLSKYDPTLVGYWDMETLTGTLLKDLSGYGNNGVCYNSGTPVTCGGGSGGPQIVDGNGKSGKVMSFDGVDDYILVNDNDVLSFTNNSFTFVFKYKTNSGGTTGLISKFGGGGTWEYSIFSTSVSSLNYLSWSSNGCCGVYGGSMGIPRSITSSDTSYKNDYWVANGTTSYVFYNGQKTTQYTKNISDLSNQAGILRIGFGRNALNTAYHNGIIDEVRVYNRALSDSEIQTLYNATR